MNTCPICNSDFLEWCETCGAKICGDGVLLSTKLAEKVLEVHRQYGDDNCWLDIDLIFRAVGLPTPKREVGDKAKMLANCQRYIETMCEGGKWASYAELEDENTRLRNTLAALIKRGKCTENDVQGAAAVAQDPIKRVRENSELDHLRDEVEYLKEKVKELRGYIDYYQTGR